MSATEDWFVLPGEDHTDTIGKKLKTGKAPRVDLFQPEIFKGDDKSSSRSGVTNMGRGHCKIFK